MHRKHKVGTTCGENGTLTASLTHTHTDAAFQGTLTADVCKPWLNAESNPVILVLGTALEKQSGKKCEELKP